MILDYNPATACFILRVPRSDKALIRELTQSHGLDFSYKASTTEEAVLYTKEPYAAVSFYNHATLRAAPLLKDLAGAIELSRLPDSPATYWSPPDAELWPFQRASVAFALQRQNCLVGDQPGLGKTPIAITVANEIEARHVLVVCPANIRRQWERKIEQWSRAYLERYPGDCKVQAITSGSRAVAEVDSYSATWNIVSYDLARTKKVGSVLAKQQFDLVILDEAHYLKTIDSQRTRAIIGGGTKREFEPILSRTSRVLALTGTPLPNRPREAYALTRALCWDAIDWASEDSFNARFNPIIVREGVRANGTPYRFTDERTGRHAELQNRLRANLMVRHLKRDVMKDLKLPVYDIIQVEETGAVKQALKAERLLDFDPESLAGADMAVLGHVAQVRHQMGVAMAPQIADYVQMLLDGGEDKLVVFAWHVEVLDILSKRLGKNGLVRVDGRTSPAAKDRLIQQFINDPKVKIALGNIQAMGTGTDGLQEVATHGLIAEPSWTPGENIQCGDRLDRGVGRKARCILTSLSRRVLSQNASWLPRFAN